MSYFGQHWRIHGVITGPISRGSANGRYRVVIEREFAELPAIETIDWSQPAIEHLRTDITDEFGLPEGYGFQVVNITYDSATRSYTLELQTERQYLGDVTGYQKQIAELQDQTAEARSRAETAEASLAAQEGVLAAAYTEGVESNG